MDTPSLEDPQAPRFEARPLTAARWSDLERLFGPRGACGGCWCMWWLLPRAQFDAQKGAANRAAFHARVMGEEVPGLLGYLDGMPAAWCAVAPRASYPALARSRTLAPVDAVPVWSVVCLYVARPFRRQGLSVRMLEAAVAHARAGGAPVVEGYPVIPARGTMPDAFAWTGVASAFAQAGFVEVARRTPTRPIRRYVLARSPNPRQ